MGLNLGVVILLRSLIPLSLVVISCFLGRDSAVKSFGGLLQRSKRKHPLHCRHPGVIGQIGQSWALQAMPKRGSTWDSPVISSVGTLFLKLATFWGFLYRFRRILPYDGGN